MNVLSRLGQKLGFKRKPQTLESKLASLDELSVDKLASIAAGDELQDLRIAAIQKLPYDNTLKSLTVSNTAARVQMAAKKRIAQLLNEGVLNFQALEKDITDKAVLFSIASFSQQNQLQEQVLAGINDNQLLRQLALEGETSNLRQLAAERISDITTLQQLIKLAKGKDKAVYRLVKDKIEQHKSATKAEEEIKASHQALCESIELHASRTFDNQYANRAQRLLEKWKAVDDVAEATMSQRAWDALGRCQGVIQAVEDAANAAINEQAEQKALVESTDEDRNRLLSEARKLIASLYTSDTTINDLKQATQGALTVLRSSWDMLEEQGPAAKADVNAFEELCGSVLWLEEKLIETGTLNELLQLLNRPPEDVTQDATQDENTAEVLTVSNETIADEEVEVVEQSSTLNPKAARNAISELLKAAKWLSDAEMPDIANTAREAVKAWDQQQKQIRDQQQKMVREIGGLIRKASAAISGGRLRQASGIWRSIEEQLEASDIEQPVSLARQLEQLEEDLNKLRDWHSYAVKPKKEALIQQAEALIGANLTPDILADRIKGLQAEWKTLSKGAHKQHEELWTVFNEYAQKAYEPCNAYFDQQAIVRKENLEKRKQLVKQLSDYLNSQDWESVDWKIAIKIVQVAREEWFSYSPTNRAETKSIQLEFDKVLGELQTKLDAEYKNNTQLKEQITSRAEKLVALEDTREAIEQVKALQVQWKNVGVMPRKQDQVLWKTFRSNCDAVFEKRAQESSAFKEQLQESADKANAHCEALEDILTLSGDKLKGARSAVEALQQAFSEIGALPKSQSKKIHQRYASVVEAYDKKLSEERKAETLASWNNYFTAINGLRVYAIALNSAEEGANSEAADQAKQSIETTIANTKQWPTPVKDVIAEALAAIGNVSNEGVLFEAELHKLCVQAEILASVDTTDEDRALRMEIQVERLQKGLGQNTVPAKAEIQTLASQWAKVGPVADNIYQPLFARFNQCVLTLV